MKMSELDYKLIDFLQIEKHVTSAVSDLRRIQHAGKYPKKVCSSAMYGANMLVSQKNIISSARAEVDRLEQENAELREFVNRIINDISGYDQEEAKYYWRNELEKILNK